MKLQKADTILEIWAELRAMFPGYASGIARPLVQIGRLHNGQLDDILPMIIKIGDYLKALENEGRD